MFTFYNIFLNNIVFILKYIFIYAVIYSIYTSADFSIHVLAYLYWYKIYLYADLKFVQKRCFSKNHS